MAASLQITADEPAPASAPTAPGKRRAGAKSPERRRAARAGGTRPGRPQLDAETSRLIEAFVKRMPEKDRAKARTELSQKISRPCLPRSSDKVKDLMKDPCSQREPQGRHRSLGQGLRADAAPGLQKIWSDTPSFGRALFQNIPKMMFIFLPLIAAVMYVLYIGSGRYYVEHLLFVVHFHAFFFLGGLLILLAERAAVAGARHVVRRRRERPSETSSWPSSLFYVPVYLFIAMRRVYGQGRFVTFLKYSALGIAYLFGLVFTVLGLLFYTALTL